MASVTKRLSNRVADVSCDACDKDAHTLSFSIFKIYDRISTLIKTSIYDEM
jgi:hypothetical protein